MDTILRDIGNSKGFVVPVQLLKELDIKVGDRLEIIIEGGNLVITPKTTRPKYKLADLLSKCDESVLIPQDFLEWNHNLQAGMDT